MKISTERFYMSDYKIPFNKVTLTGYELDNVSSSINSGKISGNGPFTKKCQSFFEETLDVKKAILTTSCTHALEMAALLFDVDEGDEFIIPSFTFVSTANSFLLRGAKPVFCDIRSDTLNIDESKIESLVTSKTKAIIPVHYAGVGCEMESIMEIASKHNLKVVEDNAHGLFGKYKGKHLGTFGQLGTLSFHETKNFTCGEGGALLINDLSYAKRAEIIWEKGTNRSLFFRGEVDKYTWVDKGSSYLPSDVLAALLSTQLESYKIIQEKRSKIWNFYFNSLSSWADKNNATLPFVPDYCEQAFHLFYILLPSSKSRDDFINHMKEQRIQCSFHYLPLHLSDMGLKFHNSSSDCLVTEKTASRLVRLPFYNSLTDDDLRTVVDAVCSFSVED